MGQRNKRKETLERLEEKTLEARLRHEIRHGLNCSPFEAEAVLDVVKEMYLPFVDPASAVTPPGTISLVAVCADEPAGKPVRACEKRTVALTVHRGACDDRVLHTRGPAAFRQGRLADVCQQALSQGGLLTREDLAYRVFFVSPRSISRDLGAVRRAEPTVMVPLRSTVHDIGPVLTHRVEIVRLALQGKTTSQICRQVRHSPQAVANYLSTFARCVQLARRQIEVGQIAFLLKRGRTLVERYLALLEACESDKTMAYHLDELLRLGTVSGKKRRVVGRGSHG